MGFHRIWHDSKGHKAEIVLFSEFRNTGGRNGSSDGEYDHPVPEDIAFSMFGRTPGMIEKDGGSRYRHDSRKKYVTALRFGLAVLPERKREIIYLKYYLGLDNSEIGKHFRVSPQAVQQALLSATKSLRDFLVKGCVIPSRRDDIKVDKTANKGQEKAKTGVRKMKTGH